MTDTPAILDSAARTRRVSATSVSAEAVMAFRQRVEDRRTSIQASLQTDHQAQLGQYFTPMITAELIANMAPLAGRPRLRILDPGAGIGSLTAALAARIATECPGIDVELWAIELDGMLLPHLEQTLAEAQALLASSGGRCKIRVTHADFVALVTGWDRSLFDSFDVVLMNPPYQKLGSGTPTRRALRMAGLDSPNLYSAFMAVGSRCLAPDGQLIAITPRSFANGTYFRPFRATFFDRVSIDRLHIFESRSSVFSDAKVLQENVILSAGRHEQPKQVVVSTSVGAGDAERARLVSYHDVLDPADPARILHIPASAQASATTAKVRQLTGTLATVGVHVSTGRVVDFRAREHLRYDARGTEVPLIFPGNVRRGRVEWPRAMDKPQAIERTGETESLLLPNEWFVLVKRFSAKEERRRLVAGLYDPSTSPSPVVAFENHLNVLHEGGRGLGRDMAVGLTHWINSGPIDEHFRTFSGHTQVNATDLRTLPCPPASALLALASALPDTATDQGEIDAAVERWVFGGRDVLQ